MPREALYASGEWAAFVGRAVWVLADLDPSSPMARELWSLVDQGAGLLDILNALIRKGVAHAPDFARRVNTAVSGPGSCKRKNRVKSARIFSRSPAAISAGVSVIMLHSAVIWSLSPKVAASVVYAAYSSGHSGCCCKFLLNQYITALTGTKSRTKHRNCLVCVRWFAQIHGRA